MGYKDMGHYTFVNEKGDATRADYTFAYHKLNGKVLISLHHSSLTWIPPKNKKCDYKIVYSIVNAFTVYFASVFELISPLGAISHVHSSLLSGNLIFWGSG